MKKRYIFLILSILCLIYTIPNGSCESGKVYLEFYTQKIFIFSVETGDIIRCDYQTYNSPFEMAIHWVYQEQYKRAGIKISGTYYEGTGKLEESGWIEIEVMEESDPQFRFGLINTGPSGYLEYNVRNLGEEARIASAWLWGGIIAVIGVVSVTGITFYFLRKKKKRKPVESPSTSSKNAL
ncbi:MAG: hypothetical protein ACFFAK_15055 [Promethearchaeota archaeon]